MRIVRAGLSFLVLAALMMGAAARKDTIKVTKTANIPVQTSETLTTDATAAVQKPQSLPSAYDGRKYGRTSRVEDQGMLGTCWAFAALTALENALLPEEILDFSEDHMSQKNSFGRDQNAGGDYIMSMAYLLSWQGPVLEAQDPYGDGFSPDGLQPAKHVQQVEILPEKDFEAIKRAVYEQGGVQSSLYTSIENAQSDSVYHQKEQSAYCYTGENAPNHDVVIVGWDDHYSRENFNQKPEGDGAFLCISSWGEKFGDGGYFYVSYYDTNIGRTNIVYQMIENTDNYDKIYQTDPCGWAGQVGYGSEQVYGANVYQAGENEQLEAVGFYATKPDTEYEIYLVENAAQEPDFSNRTRIASGNMKYAGYYTVKLEQPQRLPSGQRFAVVILLKTPGAVHPMAIEYAAEGMTRKPDLSDGEGYISQDGERWESAEEVYACNLCLKAYTSFY